LYYIEIQGGAMAKGKFIVFEGLDGAGKETQAKLLVEYLKAKEQEVVYTSEPTKDNPISKLIRKWLDRKFELSSDEAITLLYVADRYEHLSEVIIPALEAGKTVVCDRYLYSTIAYEGALFGADTHWIKQVHGHALKPHIKIYIDTSPEECINRVGKQDRFVKLETLQKVYEFYQKIIKEDRGFYVVNGNRPRAEIFEDIKKIIDKPDGFLAQRFKDITKMLGSIKLPGQKLNQ
jgi:dTMP kinase